MANRERGLFKLIYRAFISSLQSNKKPVLIGEDVYGTKYYEIPLRDESSHKRPRRYFEPVDNNDFQQELPAEWEAWLRYRRQEPPTKEEVIRNYEIMMMTKKNAAELEATYMKMKEVKQIQEPDKKEKKIGTFPVYEEFENFGLHYKPKIKK